jgi:serine/threonine-protein kinase
MTSCPTCRRRLESQADYCPYDGTPVPHEIGVGSVLGGRYHIIGELGRGGMGTVFRAWQSDLSRPVAIKVLHPYLASEPEVRARFRREAKVVARLSHPGVVELYDVGEHESGAPYLVMEYVPGESLDEVFADGSPLASRQALQLVRQIANALSCAHDAGVIHRDLKLANLLLVPQAGAPDRVKVVDFGIAKVVDGAVMDSLVVRTQMGMVCGTPEYMAPEQASGEVVDHRADYYSLGVVLYRLVTGKMPYGRSGMAAALAHVEQPVPDPRDPRPDTPTAVADLIARLMAKDPAERPSDGTELMAAIDQTAGALDRRPAPEIVSEPVPVPVAELSVPVYRDSSWGLVAFLVCLLVGGLGLYAALTPSSSGVRAERSMVPERGLEPLPTGQIDDGPRRAVITSTTQGSVRVLLPEHPSVELTQVALIDVWDHQGRPATEPVSVTVVTPDGTRAPIPAQRTDMPGRYRVDRHFAEVGVHRLIIEVGDTELAVSLDLRADSPSS